MAFEKITEADTNGKGNVGRPDTPGVSSAEMQRILDELPREVIIPKFNGLVEALETLEIEKRVKSGDIMAIRVNADNQLEVSADGVNFEATGSSGHLIVGPDGAQMPQRGRLRFTGDSVVSDSPETNETRITGVKGDKGEQGEIGPRGPQGIQGLPGRVYLPVMDDEGNITWNIVEDSGTIPTARNIRGPQGVQGTQGPQGEQGPAGPAGAAGAQGPQGPQGPAGAAGMDGRSFTVKGRYETLLDLQTDYPTGQEGDAWSIGSIGYNVVYVWDINDAAWKNVGPIQGPMGPEGPQGIQGPQGAQGEQGPRGQQGIQGVQGERGLPGPQGERGPQGTPTTVNGKSGDNINLTPADIGAATAAQGQIAEGLIDGSKTAAKAESAAAAAKLSTPRKIGSADFDGTADVTLADVGAEPTFAKNTAFNKNFGSSSDTVCQGNDSRLSNARRASNISMSLSGTTLTITYS